MAMKKLALATLFAGSSFGAQAGIVFTPHFSEYAHLPRGQYTEATFIHTQIDEVYDRNGDKQSLGQGAIRGGEEIEASLFLLKYLWAGNVFRDTDVWYLNNHDQFFRVIGTLHHQQATGESTGLSRRFGFRSNGSGFGDLFMLGGIFGDTHRWGPLQWNGLFGTTVKFPVGEYDQRSLLNPGTNYWTVIPQLAMHQNWFGRLFVDATISHQFNDDNDDPAFGGLVPSDPADVQTAEANFTWKFSERWFADIGISHRRTVEPNKFENPSANLVDQPLPPQTICNQIGINPCLPATFFIAPQAGTYEDEGIRGTLATLGFYYIYRTSAVFNARVAIPISGRGSQFDLPYDIFAGAPTGPGGSFEPTSIPISTTTTTVNGVQEAAAVSASPYLELRFVYLFWAP